MGRLLAIIFPAAFFLTACGSEWAFEEVPAPEIPSQTRILFVGNSITLHPLKPEIGWDKLNGMAASSKENDFAHQTLEILGIDEKNAYIRNFYPFETDPDVAESHVRSLEPVFAHHPAVTVLQLGDNVQFVWRRPWQVVNIYRFWEGYGALATAAAKNSGKLICLSTWWRSKIKDYVIRHHCEANGGDYVYIGDILTDPSNPDTKRQDYAHAGVDAHPKDYGMLKIAERVAQSLGAPH